MIKESFFVAIQGMTFLLSLSAVVLLMIHSGWILP